MTQVPSLTTEVLLAGAAFVAGLVDAIAGGGGLVALPALLAAGLPPHVALGTNKGQAVFGAASSAISFARRGMIDRDRAPLGFAAGFAGSLAGAWGVLAVPLRPLRVIVIVLLLVAAAVVLARRDVAARPRALGRGARAAALAAIALVLGAYDGFFGPGTGSMLVVAFAVVFGDALTRASGNAKIVNLASNLAAVLLFAGRGVVIWSVALPMAAANAAGAAVGAHLAVRKGDRLVRAVVLVVVAAVIVKLATDVVVASAAAAPAPATASPASGGTRAAPGARGDCTDDHWCWENPLPNGNASMALWGFAANDVWAAGDGCMAMPRRRRSVRRCASPRRTG
jgi:uncharacterized membrane protein YfcA